MNYKDKIKKQSAFIAIGAIMLAATVAGASYALFFQVDTNSANQYVEAGTLEVQYDNNSKSIALTELNPTSDIDALASNDDTRVSILYIRNTGNLPASYQLKLIDDMDSLNTVGHTTDASNLVEHQYIKIAIYKASSSEEKELVLGPVLLSEFDASQGVVLNDTLGVSGGSGATSNTATYVIKVWIDENAPTTVYEKYVCLKAQTISTVDEETALQ